MKLWFCLMLMAAAVWAQAPAPDLAVAFEGKVVDSATKQPVEGARVILVRMGVAGGRYGSDIYEVQPGTGLSDPESKRMAMVTERDGGFRFKVKAPATVMLFVSADGYVRTQTRFGRGATEYVLKVGEPRADLVLPIEAEAGLYGRVTDIESRQGLAGLTVVPFQYRNMTGYRTMFPGGRSAKTEEQGRFEIKGLAPGEYYLQVRQDLQAAFKSPAPEETLKDVEKRGYSRAYYPGVATVEEASPVIVLPGARMEGLDIRIAKQRVASIRGRIAGGVGLGKDPIRLMLSEHKHGRDSRSFAVIAFANLPAGSSFQLDNVPAGSYALAAFTPDRTPEELQFAQAYLEVTDENIDGIELNLMKGYTVTGRVVVGPAEGEVVADEQKPFETEMNVGILSTRSAMYSMGGQNLVNKADGTFSVPGVFPDEYRVGVGRLPKGYKVSEVRYNGSPGDWTQIEVKPGEERHVLEIVARPATSGIQVRVTDGTKPVEGAMVAVVREPVTESSLVYTAPPGTTNSEGNATFTGLLAGKYRVAAFPKGAMWRDDAGLPSTMANAQQVVLGASASATVEVRVRGR